MRRFTFILFALLLVNLSACSTSDQGNKAKEKPKEQTVDVDKGLLSVKITLPASMFKDQDINKVIADAEKQGIKVTKNPDGSLTYKMSKAKHREMMKEMKTSLAQTVDELKNGKDYPSIKDVTYNNDFSEFTLVVDKAAYQNSMDGFASMTLGMAGMMYQLYNGVDADKYKVTIFIKDQATQKVFDQIVYPDDMNEKK